jgi:uncharacterized protein
MKDILEFIISAIVENQKEVKIDEQEEDGVVNLTITVAKEDMGRVIGKSGKIIRAIRNIMKIPALKQSKKVFINLAEIPQE